MASARARASSHVHEIADGLSAGVRDFLAAELETRFALAERNVDRADENAQAWRARFSRVAKANVFDALRKDRVRAIITQRRLIVEAVPDDPRLKRYALDMLRDLEAQIDEEWGW